MPVLRNLADLGRRALQPSLSPAVGKVRPQLASRLLSSKTMPPEEKAANFLEQIGETKEDLYRLLCANVDKLDRDNMGLLKHLSSHHPSSSIETSVQAADSVWIYAGPFFAGIFGMHYFYGSEVNAGEKESSNLMNALEKAKDNEAAQAENKQEKRELHPQSENK